METNTHPLIILTCRTGDTFTAGERISGNLTASQVYSLQEEGLHLGGDEYTEVDIVTATGLVEIVKDYNLYQIVDK